MNRFSKWTLGAVTLGMVAAGIWALTGPAPSDSSVAELSPVAAAKLSAAGESGTDTSVPQRSSALVSPSRSAHSPAIGPLPTAPELPEILLSAEEAEALQAYWVTLIQQQPQEALMQLNSEPELLGTLGPRGLEALFDQFGDALLQADFLQLERMDHLQPQLRDKTLEQLFGLDSELMTDRVLALAQDNPLRQQGLYSVIDARQSSQPGVEFMEFAYGLQDPQLNELLREDYGNFEFADPLAQMEWIQHRDYLGVFTPQLDRLARQAVSSHSMEQVQAFIEAGVYPSQLASAAQARLGERSASNQQLWDWLQDRR